MERFILGRSEAVEAEYAHRSAAPITVLELDGNDGAVGVEGFRTIKAAQAHLKDGGVSSAQIEYVG